MRNPINQTFKVNAFTNNAEGGNPAAVCLLKQWQKNEVLQQIAFQNALPATAFVMKSGQYYQTQWFAPEYEIPLCGHGALAAAYILLNYYEPTSSFIEFHYPQNELLKVKKVNDQYQLELPIKRMSLVANKANYTNAIGYTPNEVYEFGHERLLLILDKEQAVRELKPDLANLRKITHRGVIVSAKGEDVDFVSRVFYPGKTLIEDQATGSAHCYLIPYWATELAKNTFHVKQVSKRGGEMWASLLNDKITLSGQAFELK